MSDDYASEWKQRISAALGVTPGYLNYTLDGAVEKIEYLVRDSAARERERERAVESSLPEPDATNPDHLRFCADILDPMDGAVDSIYLRARADRLDAARTVERERERDIKAVATALADSHKLVNAQGWIGWAEVAIKALDAVRGGGRGE